MIILLLQELKPTNFCVLTWSLWFLFRRRLREKNRGGKKTREMLKNVELEKHKSDKLDPDQIFRAMALSHMYSRVSV